jgi:hypothetical protein
MILVQRQAAFWRGVLKHDSREMKEGYENVLSGQTLKVSAKRSCHFEPLGGEKSLISNILEFGFRDFSAFGLEMTCFSVWF